MRAADFIVDVGPGAGIHGGEIVAAGTLEDIMACPRSLTGAVPVRGEEKSRSPACRRAGSGNFLTVRGAQGRTICRMWTCPFLWGPSSASPAFPDPESPAWSMRCSIRPWPPS